MGVSKVVILNVTPSVIIFSKIAEKIKYRRVAVEMSILKKDLIIRFDKYCQKEISTIHDIVEKYHVEMKDLGFVFVWGQVLYANNLDSYGK